MARPVDKSGLIEAATSSYEKMWALINTLPGDKQLVAFDFSDFNGKEAHWARDRNLRDVFIHIHEWHLLLLNWARANQGGESAPFLPPAYNWKNYGDMNAAIWERHQSTSYEAAVDLLNRSHEEVMQLIDAFTSSELFTKKYFSWTGTTNLGSYCISATSAHYDWAMKKIKQHLKSSPHKEQ